MDRRQSLNLHQRADIISGRSCTRSKAPGRFFDVGLGPLYASGSSGPMVFDADGAPYVDMVCALGAVTLGHGRVSVQYPMLCSLPQDVEVAAAEKVLEVVAPWATSVRFVKSGSEATHGAYRIAKRATGRRHVLVGDWAYHGWHEWCDDRLFDYTHRYHHGYMFGTDARGEVGSDFDRCAPNEVAAVFIEPHRWEPVDAVWLQHVRDWCTQHGALLVFDEMIYGGRWAKGGGTEFFGVQPDLACFGKAIGNGAPVACIVGGEELHAHGELVSGTYSGDGAACEVVRQVLTLYDTEPVIATLWERGKQLRDGLREVVKLAGWDDRAFVEGQPVHQRLRFADRALGRQFSAGMAARGVLWHPDVVNVSYAHYERHINKVLAAAHETLRAMNEVAQ